MLSNVEKKERKYSWSTVFAWLFLKTIGRILPKRWIKWAEDILYYDKVTTSNEVQTDDLKAMDESTQVPEVAAKESQSEVISQDATTFQDMAIQNDDLMKVDASKPEVAEKENEIASEDEGIYSAAEDLSDIEVGNKEIDNEICLGSVGDNGLIDEDYSDMEEISTKEDLNEQLEGVSLELEVDRLQNVFLEGENGELRSKNEELERENFEVTTEKEQLKLQLVESEGSYTELRKEYLVEIEEKERKIRELTEIDKVLKKEKSNLVSTAIKEREDSKNEAARLQEQVERLSAELEKVRSIAMLSIGEHTKTLDENLTLKNQHIENSLSEDEQLDGELKEKDTQEQKKSHKTGAVSLDSKYNEKLVQSHTESSTLEDKVKQYTPMTCISSIASIHSLHGQRAVRAGS